MLNLAHIGAFLAIIDAGSFHQAAIRLGVAQSTVSHSLKRLEETVGARLIVRSHNGCVASRQGEIFLPFARSLVALSERSLARIRSERMRIGASSNVGIYLLQPYLARLARSGLAESDLVIGPNPEIADRLEGREIDLAFMEWWDGRPGFAAAPWKTDRLVLIVAPDHPWANLGALPAEDLFDAAFLGGERGTGTGTLLRHALGADASRLKMTRQLGSTEAVKRAVAAGLGVSLVLESAVVDEVAIGRLCVVPLAGLTLQKTLWAVHPCDLPAASPVVRSLDLLMAAPEAAAVAVPA